MFKYLQNQNIFNLNTEAVINTVNCVGVMGKGLALQFKQKFPENFKVYKKKCINGEINIGKMFIFNNGLINKPKFIINFPTKKHWREKSQLAYIEKGLQDLKKVIIDYKIKSISIPPLGCGLGGLKWKDVKNLIIESLSDLDICIVLYEKR